MDSHLAAVAVSVDDRVYAEVLYCKECYLGDNVLCYIMCNYALI